MNKRKDYGEIGFREIINLKISDISVNTIRDLFAASKKQPQAKYDVAGTILVPKDYQNKRINKKDNLNSEYNVLYAPNWDKIKTTTCGRLLVNNILFSNSFELRSNFPYYDEPFDKHLIGAIEQRLTDLVIQEKITMDDFNSVTDKLQHIGFGCTFFIAPSMTSKTISLPPKAAKLKAELLKKHAAELAANNLSVISDIEKQILTIASDELDGTDPGWEIYKSGARGSISNNFKNTAVMRGAIFRSDDPKKVKISTASLESGIPADEFENYADMMVFASYSRSVGTQAGGCQKEGHIKFL